MDSLQQTANGLMRAVVNSNVIREGAHREADISLASRVMREELKAFLGLEGDTKKYEDERALAMQSGSGLAMASLVATCIERIAKERAQ